MRLIDADALLKEFEKRQEQQSNEYCDCFLNDAQELSTEWWCVEDAVTAAPTINAVEIPCDIGTVVYYTKPTVYASDIYKGVKRGRVVGFEITKNEKFVWVRFDSQPEEIAMAIAFEKFGTGVFLSEHEALKALHRRDSDG